MTERRKPGSLLLPGLAVLVAAGTFLWLLTPARQPDPAIGGPFRLESGAIPGNSSRIVTDRDFRGSFLLVYFGYTHCPDLCPTTLLNIAQALKLMGREAKHVQPLFITIDPSRDTPAAIGPYVALFSPRILGLTGSARAIHRVEREYHVYVGPENPKTGMIDHGAILYVMDPDGKFLAGLKDDLDASQLAAELDRLIKSHQRD